MKALPQSHGHRGARGLFPENSLVAVQAALDHHCDAIEVDLCVSADNHLVIHHDPILASYLVRTSKHNWVDEELKLRNLRLAQIKEFDIGRIKPETRYARRFSDQQSVDGTKIPVLEELIELVLSQSSSVIFNLELKSTPYHADTMPPVNEYCDLVASRIDSLGIRSRTFLQSFDWRLPLSIKEKLPDLKIGLLTDLQHDGAPQSPIRGDRTLWTNGLDLSDFEDVAEMIHSTRAEVWSSNALDLDANDVKKAHQLGLEVYVWTVNDVSQMQQMVDYQVDAITTDYPDRLAQVYASQITKPA